jgi:predicted transcriptional regulator
MNRDRYSIYYSILNTIRRNAGRCHRTYLMYAAYLSFDQLKEHLYLLMQKDLVSYNGYIYGITLRGEKYVKYFEEMDEMLEGVPKGITVMNIPKPRMQYSNRRGKMMHFGIEGKITLPHEYKEDPPMFNPEPEDEVKPSINFREKDKNGVYVHKDVIINMIKGLLRQGMTDSWKIAERLGIPRGTVYRAMVKIRKEDKQPVIIKSVGQEGHIQSKNKG